MSPELIAILSVGVVLAGLLITLMQQTRGDLRGDLQQLRGDLQQLRSEVRALETRVAAVEQGQARIEGLIDGLREAISGRGQPAA